MGAAISQEQRKRIDEVIDSNPTFAKLVYSMAEVADTPNLCLSSDTVLANPFATLPGVPTTMAGKFEYIDGYRAVVGKVFLYCQQLDTLLSKGSFIFDMSRLQHTMYAEELGYNLATRDENWAYINSLLAKNKETINAPEKYALNTYRRRPIRDDKGGLHVVGREVRDFDLGYYDFCYPSYGALFVRRSRETK